ncbi:MAG TPA: YIP1 family protein [Terriglobales bacterium]|nr:YIP1 family protein [Terriglobales bacterium]
MSASAPQPVPAPAMGENPPSIASRILNIFFAPTKVFSDINRRPAWIVPFLIIALFSVVFSVAVDMQIGFEKVSENQIKLNPKAAERMERASPEQRAQQMAVSVIVTKVISYGFPVLMLAMYAIIAAVMLGTFNFGMGAQIRYGVAFAVIVYSALPGILKTVLATVSLFAGVDPDGFIIQNPVATNPAVLVDITTHPILYSLAASFDIFQIWTLVLAGIGFSCVSKVKRGTAMATVFGWYFAFTLGSVGISALFM